MFVQDTNTIQYELMKLFAKEGNVTIVGDPDQAIYGWRAAGKIRNHLGLPCCVSDDAALL
jgi:superfamily I DNA/RNA helicase